MLHHQADESGLQIVGVGVQNAAAADAVEQGEWASYCEYQVTMLPVMGTKADQ